MQHRLARAPRGRTEHFTADGKTTLCGADARPMAKFFAHERGGDSKTRPLCAACRAAKR